MTLDIDISARIREDILSGGLPFGARVTIAELAQRYGVSQMPVRVAFGQLQGEGLLTISDTGRASIRAVDRDFIGNVFDIRRELEALLIRSAADRISDTQLQELEAIEATLEQMVHDQNYAEVQAANRRFHSLVSRAAHNDDAVELIDRHFFLVAALWRRVSYGPERFSGVVNDHRFILKALRLRDADAAVALSRAHVTKAKLVLLEYFDKMLEESAKELPKKTRREKSSASMG
jgi:DNA-binding GntR family transcriptional regulator